MIPTKYTYIKIFVGRPPTAFKRGDYTLNSTISRDQRYPSEQLSDISDKLF
jgi:hypothetical protein